MRSMSHDVDEQLFNERQLYAGDVVGEADGDQGDHVDARPVLLPGGRLAAGASAEGALPANGALASTASAEANTAAGRAAARGANGEAGSEVVVATASSGKGGRRKRNTERATQIIFCLESKYDILFEVCGSFEGWKEGASNTCDFDLLWSDTAVPADRFMKLKPYQKMNHFVGMSSITRKNNLGRNLLRMRKQFPQEYKFFPDTWILPTDLSDFKQQFAASKRPTFIVKPDNGCQGKGIFLVRDVEKVPVDFSTTYVAQRYLHKPFLLDGFKFDLRLYVLVVGCDPLRIFLHRRGLARLASEQYVEPTAKNLSQPMVHLTNYAINKLNPNFEENTNPDDALDGHKRSWEAVHEHLRKEGFDVDTLLEQIEDLIIKTLIAVQPSLSHFYHSCQPEDKENAMCFEVLGFDVMLDHKLQPWLLEVNHAPSFATESELDRVVKDEVLRDTFTLLNLDPEARRQKKREAREKMEQRAMGVAKKQSLEERIVEEKEVALHRTKWEDDRCNGYKRLYPSQEKERKYMMVHDAAISIWEMLMGGNSRRAVRLFEPTEEEAAASRAEIDRRKGAASSSASGIKAASQSTEASVGPPARTKEEIQEVIDRLANGCSARPRAGACRRGRRTQEPQPRPFHAGSEPHVGPGSDGPNPTDQGAEPKQGPTLDGKREVKAGDMVMVQTNLGWETVMVRARRPNGKIDIRFKDGEYMRSVLPRILRGADGTPCVSEPDVQGLSAATALASSYRGSDTRMLPRPVSAAAAAASSAPAGSTAAAPTAVSTAAAIAAEGPSPATIVEAIASIDRHFYFYRARRPERPSPERPPGSAAFASSVAVQAPAAAQASFHAASAAPPKVRPVLPAVQRKTTTTEIGDVSQRHSPSK